MFVSESWNLQRSLSQAQTTLIVGPLLVSPVKALFSLVQLIVGIAGTILFGTLFIIIPNDYMMDKCFQSLEHAGMGFLGFIYSASNFISLGLVGYRIEHFAT